MLKRLKQTWIEEGAQSKSQSPAPLSEVAISPTPFHHELPLTTSKDEREDTLPAVKNASSSVSVSKRSRDTFETDTTDVIESARPAKLLKTVDLDPLRNHLPEILDSRERYESQSHLNLSTLKERIFVQATQDNSEQSLSIMMSPAYHYFISYCWYSSHERSDAVCRNADCHLHSFVASMTLLIELLTWAIDVEAQRPKSIASRSRTVVIIVELVLLALLRSWGVLIVIRSDVSSMDKYVNAFESSLPSASVGKYTDEVHRPEPETWSNFLKKDVVLAPSHVCLQFSWIF